MLCLTVSHAIRAVTARQPVADRRQLWLVSLLSQGGKKTGEGLGAARETGVLHRRLYEQAGKICEIRIAFFAKDRSGRRAGQSVLVSGSAFGIGRATAAKFAEEGASLLVQDIQEHRLLPFRDELEHKWHGTNLRHLRAAPEPSSLRYWRKVVADPLQ
jgi:hypothetical protein